jgi:hypothetical protein
MSTKTPITHLAIKYPAPICEECDQVMLTVTDVYNRRLGEPFAADLLQMPTLWLYFRQIGREVHED